MTRKLSILIVLLIATTASGQKPFDLLEEIVSIGLENPELPTSLRPPPTVLIKYCTEQLKLETSRERRARLYECRSQAYRLNNMSPAARADAAEAWRLLPADPRITHYYAQLQLVVGDAKRAMELSNELIADHPQFAPAYVLRAHIKLHKYIDVAGALRDTARAIQLDPNYPEAHLIHTMTYSVAGANEEALSSVQKYFEFCAMGPTGGAALPFYIKGILFNRLGRHREAIASFDMATQFKSRSIRLAGGMWSAQRSLRNRRLALIAAHFMRDVDPTHEDTARAMGISFLEAGRFQNAIPYLKKWCDFDRDQGDRINWLLAAEFGAGNHAAVKLLFDRATQQANPLEGVRLMRAVFLLTCPDPEVQNHAESLNEVAEILKEDLLDDKTYMAAVLVQYCGAQQDLAITNLESRINKRPQQSAPEAKTMETLLANMKAGKTLAVSIPLLAKLNPLEFDHRPYNLLDDVVSVGLVHPQLPTSLRPSLDVLTTHCTEQLKIEMSRERRARLYECRSQAHFLNSKLMAGKADAIEAWKLLPEDPRITLLYAQLHFLDGESQLAIDLLGELIDDHPRFALAYALRAQIKLAEHSNVAAALRDTARAIQLDPNCPQAHWMRCTAHGSAKDYGAALSSIERYLELRPRGQVGLGEVTYSMKGMLLARVGRHREAITAFDMALRYRQRTIGFGRRALVVPARAW